MAAPRLNPDPLTVKTHKPKKNQHKNTKHYTFFKATDELPWEAAKHDLIRCVWHSYNDNRTLTTFPSFPRLFQD
jgi:hypothetical protein